MFATISRRIASWVSKKDRVYLLLGVLCLLGSVTLTAHALLTVSNSGLLGDGAVTIDGAGVLNLGTASSTAVVIGNSGIPVTIPGTLTLGSASSTGQLIFRNASTSFTTTLQASSSQASNLTLTLPPTLGTSGQAMLTDGTGNLYFGNAASSQWLSGASGTIYYNSGNVGINTSTPTALLSLVGSSSSPASLFNISSSSGASLFNVSGNGTVTVGTTVLPLAPYSVAAYAGADAGAKINACLTALPAGGGICDARTLTGAQSAAATITVPANKTLLLGATTIIMAGTPGLTFDSYSTISGLGPRITTLVSNISNTSAVTAVNTSVRSYQFTIRGMTIYDTAATAPIALNLTNHNSGRIENVELEGSSGVGTGLLLSAPGTPPAVGAYYNDFYSLQVNNFAVGVDADNGANENHFFGGFVNVNGTGFRFGYTGSADHNAVYGTAIESSTVNTLYLGAYATNTQLYGPRLESTSVPYATNVSAAGNFRNAIYSPSLSGTGWVDPGNTLEYTPVGSDQVEQVVTKTYYSPYSTSSMITQSGWLPGVNYIIRRADTGGMATPLMNIQATNSITGLSANLGQMGLLGSLGSGSTPPSISYLYFGADATTGYDSNALRILPNKAVAVEGSLTISESSPIGTANRAVCWKTTTTLGYCSTIIGANGSCTCN